MLDRKIRIFMAVVEEGSFSAAGKKLLMSQSAVSQQITHLEKELGMVLFNRDCYRPQLTKEGQFYYREVKRLHDDYLHVLDYMKLRMKKHITIGFNCIFDRDVFANIIDAFQKDSGEHFEFKYFELDKYKEVFAHHLVDAVIGLGAAFQNDEQVTYYKVCELEVCAAVSLKHRLAHTKSIDVHELENEPMIAIKPEASYELYQDFLASFYKDGMRPHIVKTVNTMVDLKTCIALGEGIGYVARELCFLSDGLHLIHLEHTHHHAEFGVAYKDPSLDCLAKKFVSFYQNYKLGL